MVNCLHETPLKIPKVHTLAVISAITPVIALSVPSFHPSDYKHQELPE